MRCPQEVGLHGPWRIGAIWTIEDLRKKVRNAIKRVYSSLLPATLSLEQWLVTVDHFAGKCAYCRRRRFEILEHVVPVLSGGGTTAGNCLPACFRCNAKKSNKSLREAFPEIAVQLEDYLAGRSTGKDVGKPPQDVMRFRATLFLETRLMSTIASLYFQREPLQEVMKRLDGDGTLTEAELEKRRKLWMRRWYLAS